MPLQQLVGFTLPTPCVGWVMPVCCDLRVMKKRPPDALKRSVMARKASCTGSAWLVMLEGEDFTEGGVGKIHHFGHDFAREEGEIDSFLMVL